MDIDISGYGDRLPGDVITCPYIPDISRGRRGDGKFRGTIEIKEIDKYFIVVIRRFFTGDIDLYLISVCGGGCGIYLLFPCIKSR